jgi:VWFA-related protein
MFLMGYHLIQVEGYTNQAERLDAAADRAAMKGFGPVTAKSQARLSGLKSSSVGSAGPPQRQLDPSSFSPGVLGSAEERGPETDIRVASVRAAIERLNTIMVNQVYGSTMMDELGALIQQQAALPGRKTVLFLSEGLTVPAEFPERFRTIIGTANRGNITFNTVNCKGLTTENRSDAAARWASEEVGKWDVDENLRDLAEETGGIAMDNSNDLRQTLARAMEAVRSHYEITYQPQSEVNDGRYRKLKVNVSRPGARVQSRDVYYAPTW